MGLLDILAKLGILRVGAKAGTYRTGTERPIEFMDDDVLNADRDLINRPARFCKQCGAELDPVDATCGECGSDTGR